jgi:hypothetical protein
MTTIVKKVSPAVPAGERYLHLIGGTDFANGDVIDILASLGGTAKQISIVCDAYSSITIRFNAIQIKYPEVVDNQFVDRQEPRKDYSNPIEIIDTTVHEIALANGDVFTFDKPCRNIQVTALSGAPEITAE